MSLISNQHCISFYNKTNIVHLRHNLMTIGFPAHMESRMLSFIDSVLHASNKMGVIYCGSGNLEFIDKPQKHSNNPICQNQCTCFYRELKPDLTYNFNLQHENLISTLGVKHCELLYVECLVSAEWIAFGHSLYFSSPKEAYSNSTVRFVVGINVNQRRITYFVSGPQHHVTHSHTRDPEHIETVLDLIGAYVTTPASLFSYCYRSIWDNKIEIPDLPLFEKYKKLRDMLVYFRTPLL